MLPKSYCATCGVYDMASEPANSDVGRGETTSGTEVIDNRGIALSSRTRQVLLGLHAMFTPQPTQRGEIAPSTTFYVAVADAEPRDPVGETLKKPPTCRVDFAELARDHVLRCIRRFRF
ncbi:hypothetical protein QBC44DRAFT_403935 [Cladorrhinum sp. PSN332]|nr:hypothetical protein QBC44DRAFT_403935 [Cladorrhinum sp. PSN332]